jgi:regulator of replication initiation timing
MSAAPETVPETAPVSAEPCIDAIVGKVQRHLDQLKAKNAKLAEDNQKLKQQLAEARSSNSRVARIPRKKPAAESA